MLCLSDSLSRWLSTHMCIQHLCVPTVALGWTKHFLGQYFRSKLLLLQRTRIKEERRNWVFNACVEVSYPEGSGLKSWTVGEPDVLYLCFFSILIIQRLRTPLGTTQRCGYAVMLAAQDMHHGPLSLSFAKVKTKKALLTHKIEHDKTEERDIFTRYTRH